jgi:large subunit ribosomal protein L21
MFAVVEIAGKQFECEPKKILKVPLLPGNPGDVMKFGNVILAKPEADMIFGQPYTDFFVQARILEHGKDGKVIVFKKKRRKGYRKLNKHRQMFTKIEVTGIGGPGFEMVIEPEISQPIAEVKAPKVEKLALIEDDEILASSSKEDIIAGIDFSDDATTEED